MSNYLSLLVRAENARTRKEARKILDEASKIQFLNQLYREHFSNITSN